MCERIKSEVDEYFETNVELSDPTFRPIDVQPLSHSPKKRKQKCYRKKVESEWSEENIFKLIQEMEARSYMWDVRCTEYKLPKDTAWQEVADALQMGVNDCKGKWSNLRTSFNSNLDKYHKKKSVQGTNDPIQITWKFFKPMMFLERNKVRQLNQSTTSVQSDSAVDDHSVLLDHGEWTAQELVSTSTQRRKRKCSTTSPSPSPSDTSRTSNLKQMAVEALQSMRFPSSQPKDVSTAFCEYMASELQNLSAEQAAFARSKMRRAFIDILDEAVLMPPA